MTDPKAVEEALAWADLLDKVLPNPFPKTQTNVRALAAALRECRAELADAKKLDAIHVQDQYPLLQRALKAEQERDDLKAEIKELQYLREIGERLSLISYRVAVMLKERGEETNLGEISAEFSKATNAMKNGGSPVADEIDDLKAKLQEAVARTWDEAAVLCKKEHHGCVNGHDACRVKAAEVRGGNRP